MGGRSPSWSLRSNSQRLSRPRLRRAKPLESRQRSDAGSVATGSGSRDGPVSTSTPYRRRCATAPRSGRPSESRYHCFPAYWHAGHVGLQVEARTVDVELHLPEAKANPAGVWLVGQQECESDGGRTHCELEVSCSKTTALAAYFASKIQVDLAYILPDKQIAVFATTAIGAGLWFSAISRKGSLFD
jgi:hypothetical protein